MANNSGVAFSLLFSILYDILHNFYFQLLVSVKSPDHPAIMKLKVSFRLVYAVNSEIFAEMKLS